MIYDRLREMYGSSAFKLWAHYPFEQHFLNPLVAPKEIEFKKGLPEIKPQQVIIMSNGEVASAIYYADEQDGVYSHPLARVEFEWERQAIDGNETRLSKRIATASWSLVGDADEDVVWASEPEHVKIWHKSYNDRTGRIADKRKRANIIDGLLAQVGPFGVLPYVQTMLNSLDDERNGYIDTYDVRFINKVISYSGQWLEADVSAPLGLPAGTTLRQAILGALDYDVKVIGG